jgi:hypothetical protein
MRGRKGIDVGILILCSVCLFVLADNVVPAWVDSPICTIPRNDTLNLEYFEAEFKGRSPVIFSRPIAQTASTRERMEQDNLLTTFGALDVHPARMIDPQFVDPAFLKVPLSHYAAELMNTQGPATPVNESWNIFGPVLGEGWAALLQDYPIPSFVGAEFDKFWWGVAPLYSGLSFHGHGAAFSETIRGRKRWYLASPTNRPAFSPFVRHLHWVISRGDPELLESAAVMECTLGPGDVIYVPPSWFHATLNLEPWTAFVTTFTREPFHRGPAASAARVREL